MVEEYSARAKQINQQFLCITDHGMMGSVPRQIRACEKDKINPLFGCELYVNPMQIESREGATSADFNKHLSDDEKVRFRKSYHLLAIAYNEIGYSNLVKLSSWGWTKGFYFKPRVNHEQLMLHKEGIIFTSCCYSGEIGQAFDRGGDEEAFPMLEKYMAMFMPHFYLEMMLLDFSKQKPYDAFILRAHNKYHIPVIVTQDCHYCLKEDSKMQRLMLMVQTGKTIKGIQAEMDAGVKTDFFELQDQNLWMKSEDELNEKWESDYQDIIDYDIFKQAKRNTVEICQFAKGVQLDRSIKLPQIENDNDKLLEAIQIGMRKRGVPTNQKYADRIKEEYSLISQKGFSSYFLIQKMMTDEARRISPELLGWGDGSEAVGPGRGCHFSNTPIVMKDGSTKLIKDVNASDFVITIDGTAQKVIRRLEYNIEQEDLILFKSFYGDHEFGVGLTKEHKILCEKLIRPKNWGNWSENTKNSRKSLVEPTGDLHWIPADEVDVGDWVFCPIPITNELSINTIDLSQFCVDKGTWFDENYVYEDTINNLTGNVNNHKIHPRYLNLDDEWFTIFGIFTGDGWLVKRSKNLGFVWGEKEKLTRDLLNFKFLSVGCELRERPCSYGKKCSTLIVKSHIFHNLFKFLFANYNYTAQTKHVPELVMNSSVSQKRYFLKGYHLADGGEDKYKSKYTSTSRTLLDQVRFLFWQIGFPASISKYHRIEKRKNRKNHEESCVRTPHIDLINSKESTTKYRYRKLDNGYLTQISSKEILQGISKVYDLEIENNHNYLTSSFLVHNSVCGSLIAYTIGITDVDPIRHDLLFSRFLSPARGGRSMKLKFSSDPIKKQVIEEISKPITVVEECPFEL